ncbi:alpha/beta hydrolase [Actinoplanes sp. RD1]|uniref:alpha/beta hydrolase n=1 Tax=Actinoplanes sp. RD1 TaxID=3064538 RepID=UPI0027423538|nr:alpha/beta hydrolase [Actinoplanes sp. RD1]
MTDVIICHGAWHQPAHFRALVDRLERDGLTVEVPDLGGLSLPESHKVVQDIVDSSPRLPLVVAHSNGGITAGTVRGAASMLFLSAWVLDAGESPQSLIEDVQRRTGVPGAPLPVTVDGEGLLRLDEDGARAGLYADCDDETAALAVSLLRPEPPSIFAAVPTVATWKDTRTFYLAGSKDRAIVPELVTTFASRCSTTETWPTSHSAYLSRTGDVAALIHRQLAR